MCCRYALLQNHANAVLAQAGALLDGGEAPRSRHNIAPGTGVPAVRNRPGRSDREAVALHWGLVPSWARDAANPAPNARAESLAEKPTFRDALRQRRCLIPASGFYEWAVHGRARQPWLFRRRDETPFAFAGLWETWRAPNGDLLESCTLITTTPNAVMEPIHHRMPVLLADTAAWDRWLDPRMTQPDALLSLLRPFPAELMTAVAVSSHVNSVRNDDPLCWEPAEPETQLGLAF
jgi:putative SOS response-associated peptidase YedK